jgi:hypothetical protein
MLRNRFGSHVPSVLQLLDDTQKTQITNILVHWEQAALIIFISEILKTFKNIL